MSHTVLRLFGTGIAILGLAAASADEPKKPANTNALVKEFKGKLAVTCSTFWPGWPPERAFDGDLKTSWFTERGDTVVNKKKPWIKVEFPRDVEVQRVTVHGNREHPWEKGYAFLAGKVELLDKDGTVLATDDNDGMGDDRDFEFTFKKPVGKVRAVKFTALGDEGDKNPYDDVAVGEIEIE
jgi:hypothetical protein